MPRGALRADQICCHDRLAMAWFERVQCSESCGDQRRQQCDAKADLLCGYQFGERVTRRRLLIGFDLNAAMGAVSGYTLGGRMGTGALNLVEGGSRPMRRNSPSRGNDVRGEGMGLAASHGKNEVGL